MTTTPTHLDPFHRPPHGALTTRFEINYLCSLCDNQIELSDTIYFSDYAQDFDELWQKFQNHIDDPMNLAELLLPAVRSHHHDQPLPEPVPVELTYARQEHITEYYCIDCNRPFETIGSLRIHMGCNPVTNHSISMPMCIGQRHLEPPIDPELEEQLQAEERLRRREQRHREENEEQQDSQENSAP